MMRLRMRTVLPLMSAPNPGFFAAFVVIAVLGAAPVAAQPFPTKPINLVIPFGAGGASDLAARTFVGTAAQFLGQPIVVQIKPGGGGAIASEMVAQSKPDGYTLLFGHTNSNSILPAIEGRSKGPDDLASVCRINTSGSVFLAQPNAPFKTFREMVAWAKANPGKLSIANAGTWSMVDFAWRQMEVVLGLRLRIVSYDGGAEALVALLGGHVQAALLSLPQTLPHVKAGKLQALAFMGERRHPDLPEVPTTTEEGYDKTMTVFKAVMAPKATPRPVIDKLSDGFRKMLETKQAIDGIRQLGEDVEFMGPDDFAKYWKTEYETYKELGKIFKK
jgi:tripartite-type tricarboxylate transporter receptor subunit TctC